MSRARTAAAVATIVCAVALGLLLVGTALVLTASLSAWLLSRYLPFTFFEAAGLSLAAQAVIALAATRLFATFMTPLSREASGVLERHAREAAEREREEDDDNDERIVFVQVPNKPVSRRAPMKSRRSK